MGEQIDAVRRDVVDMTLTGAYFIESLSPDHIIFTVSRLKPWI